MWRTFHDPTPFSACLGSHRFLILYVFLNSFAFPFLIFFLASNLSTFLLRLLLEFSFDIFLRYHVCNCPLTINALLLGSFEVPFWLQLVFDQDVAVFTHLLISHELLPRRLRAVLCTEVEEAIVLFRLSCQRSRLNNNFYVHCFAPFRRPPFCHTFTNGFLRSLQYECHKVTSLLSFWWWNNLFQASCALIDL